MDDNSKKKNQKQVNLDPLLKRRQQVASMNERKRKMLGLSTTDPDEDCDDDKNVSHASGTKTITLSQTLRNTVIKTERKFSDSQNENKTPSVTLPNINDAPTYLSKDRNKEGNVKRRVSPEFMNCASVKNCSSDSEFELPPIKRKKVAIQTKKCSSSPEPDENIDLQDSSITNCSTDTNMIENSDTESESFLKTNKPVESINTSTFSLPRTHPFFVSPQKFDENRIDLPRKITVISDIQLKPPLFSSSPILIPATPEKYRNTSNTGFTHEPHSDQVLPSPPVEIIIIPATPEKYSKTSNTAFTHKLRSDQVLASPPVKNILISATPEKYSKTSNTAFTHKPRSDQVLASPPVKNILISATPEKYNKTSNTAFTHKPRSDQVLASPPVKNILISATPEKYRKTSNSAFTQVPRSDQVLSPPPAENIPATPEKNAKPSKAASTHEHRSDQVLSPPPAENILVTPEKDAKIPDVTFTHDPRSKCLIPSPSIIDVPVTPEKNTCVEALVAQNVSRAESLSSSCDIAVAGPSNIVDNTKNTIVVTPTSNKDIDSPACNNMNLSVMRRKKRLCASTIKSFIDFASEDEQDDFSAGSSDVWSANEIGYSSDDSNKKPKKRKGKASNNNAKNHKMTSDNTKEKSVKHAMNEKAQTVEHADLIEKKKKKPNKRKQQKSLKDKGLSYETKKGDIIAEKVMKNNPCIVEKCKRKCYEIPEERRTSLFNHFYSLDPLRRRDWLIKCSKIVPPKRSRVKEQSRRTTTMEHFINEGEGHRKVCQKFLLNTLDITQKYLRYSVANATDDMAQKELRKPNSTKVHTEETKNYVHTFIKKLPTMPSHYSRKRSNKMYLPQEFRNMANIYRIYKWDCEKNHQDVVSESLFRKIFKEYNLSIHVPKKDKCVVCTKAENNKGELNAEDSEKLKKHLEEKEAMKKRFKLHQNLKSSRKDTITTSFDLQKVLNTPHGESMLLYYSRKYAVFNFTLYESQTSDAFCYTWGESDGGRGSNEIATCVLQYLKQADDNGIKTVLLYCDSCTGQNKNKNMLAAMNHFLKTSKNIETIQVNFLLPGHTYMPVDSVHAVIEREVKKLIVWGPSQWATYFESARKNPRPYKATILDYTDFLDLSDLGKKTFTTTTLRKLKFSQIRIATFKKKKPDYVLIKYSMMENTEEVEVKLFDMPGRKISARKKQKKGKGKGKGKRPTKQIEENRAESPTIPEKSKTPAYTIKPLFTQRLPISERKYKDLMELIKNGTVPKAYHAEYRCLPSSANTLDVLPESDQEDGNDEDDTTEGGGDACANNNQLDEDSDQDIGF